MQTALHPDTVVGLTGSPAYEGTAGPLHGPELPYLRRRNNWPLYLLACKPLDDLRGTADDQWEWVQGPFGGRHQRRIPTPGFEAAADLVARKVACYHALIPVGYWPSA